MRNYPTCEVITDILSEVKHPLRDPRSRPAGSDAIITNIDYEGMAGCSIKPGVGDLHPQVVQASLETAQVGDHAWFPPKTLQALHGSSHSFPVIVIRPVARFIVKVILS